MCVFYNICLKYMTYSNENRNAGRYNLRGIEKRDEFDDEQKAIQSQFASRHSSQLGKASAAEGVDGEWIEDKNKVIELNRDIRIRRKNFDTYKNAIEVEKTLYNRERHTTILLGCMNAAAIGGCLYVWLM